MAGSRQTPNESLGLTIETLPAGSPQRDIAETIQQVMKLDGCSFDTATERVRTTLMQAKIPLDCVVWGQAKAAAEAAHKAAKQKTTPKPSSRGKTASKSAR